MSNTNLTDQVSAFQRFEFFLGVVNRMLIGFVTIYVSWLCLRTPSWAEVPWHALLCTIGFNCLAAEGLIFFYRGNSPTVGCCRGGRIRFHIALQVIGSTLGIAGIVVRMTIDEIHFSTLHGQLGLAALVFCFGGLFSGFSVVLSVRMKKCLQPIFNKTLHSAMGLATYTTAMVCLFYGFETYIFEKISSVEAESSANVKNLLKVATLGILVLTAYGPLMAAVHKLWNYVRDSA